MDTVLIAYTTCPALSVYFALMIRGGRPQKKRVASREAFISTV
jgi:hypothetical protein